MTTTQTLATATAAVGGLVDCHAGHDHAAEGARPLPSGIGLAVEAATLAGIRSALNAAYCVTVIAGGIHIQGYACHGAGQIADRLDLTRDPSRDNNGFRYFTGRLGVVRVTLVVDTQDPR